MKYSALAAALAVATAAPALADTAIDTTAPFTGGIQPFGEPDTATYGQTFTVGSDNVLNSFSLYLDGTPNASISFQAYLYAWDGSKASGSALYTSALQTFTGTAAGNPLEFAFNTGGTALTTGAKYVAFLSTSGLQSGGNMTAEMPYSGEFGSDALPGGNFVFYNNGDDFAALTNSGWECADNCSFGDAWFKASLSDVAGGVPEPSAWAMLIVGLGVVGGAMRSRRRTGVAFA